MRQNVKAIEKFRKTQTLGLGIYILIYDLCDKIVIALIVMMLFLAPTFLFYLAWAPDAKDILGGDLVVHMWWAQWATAVHWHWRSQLTSSAFS